MNKHHRMRVVIAILIAGNTVVSTPVSAALKRDVVIQKLDVSHPPLIERYQWERVRIAKQHTEAGRLQPPRSAADDTEPASEPR